MRLLKKSLRGPRPCVVTALDLLGFDDSPMPEGRVRRVVAFLDRHLGDVESARRYDCRLWVIDRQVLHVAPIQRAGMPPFHAALRVAHLQADLISLGALVRGAITFEDVTVEGDLAFGPGISRARRLCDEVADVPRVIIDARLLQEVEWNPDLRAAQHTAADELGFLRELLSLDADGLWFIDYLWALRSEVRTTSTYEDFLQDHQRVVTQKLDGVTALDRRSHAWTWLWSYHNSTMKRLARDWQGEKLDLAHLSNPATRSLLYRFPSSAKAHG